MVGSISVATDLASVGLVDEYRLLVCPDALGTGRRLFPGAQRLTLVEAVPAAPAVFLRYEVSRAG